MTDARTLEDDLGLTLSHDGRRVELGLSKLFEELAPLSQEDRETSLALTLAGALGSARVELSVDEALAALEPVLCPAVYGEVGLAPLVRFPFLPHLFAYVVIDGDRQMRLLLAEEAQRLSKSHRELLFTALRNLAAKDHTIRELSHSPGVWELACDDGFAASRLLLPGFIAALAGELGGPVLVAVPDPSTLQCARRDHEGAVRALLELAEHAWKQSERGVSPMLYEDADGEVAPFSPPSEDPLADGVQRARALLLVHAHSEQREALERAAEAEGAPLAIERCGATHHPALGVCTTTRWQPGEETLLPETDLVLLAFAEDEVEQLLVVARDDLHHVVGTRLVPLPDSDPPLWLAAGFPNEEERARLAAVALASLSSAPT